MVLTASEILPLMVSILVGVVICGAAMTVLGRRRLAAANAAHDVNLAVVQSSLDARTREVENLNHRIQEIQSRLVDRETALQQALVTEASLSTRTDEMHRGVTRLEAEHDELRRQHEELRSSEHQAHRQIAELQTRLTEQQKQNEEKLTLLEKAREQMNTEFKQIAGEIFEAKQKTFKAESREQLDSLLTPLGDRIKEFEKRVENSYNEESKERFSLIREVRNLQDLNARISKDAVNLTNALKGENKTQGTWGEVILERVLEKSGLVRDREYEIQVAARNEEGRRLQPDVVVHLPEDKDVVIDAKVSLVAYERYCSAQEPAERKAALAAHVQSLRGHLKALSSKDYQNLTGLRTLDFVLLFIPVEAAFSVAVQEDGELFGDAFDRNIMLVAPSTLLATLRMIQNIWRYEQQNRNAQEIADRAGKLYDKFVGFVADIEDIGKKLGSTQAAYQDAYNKLSSGRGNLVGRAEAMKELGAKTSKSLPANLVEMPRRDEAHAGG